MITSPPHQGSAFPTYDPLATQFMTGGQMGYMPDAQFLTGSKYGAFRTMPAPTTQYSQAYQQQTLWQSYLMSSQGGIPGLPGKYLVDIYNPGVNFHLQRTMASRRMQDVKGTVMGTAADLGWSLGASALTGAAVGTAFGGPAGTVAGLAAGFLAPAISPGYVDRMRGGREMQLHSMAKIFSGPDVSATLGQGFSMSSATRIDEHMRRSASRDMAYKYGDYKGFTQEAMGAGLMDFSNDVEQYKQAITRGMKNLKVISGLLGSQDYKEVVQHMKRLMTMGAGMDSHVGMMANEQTFARMAGMTVSQMVDTYGQQGSLIFNQHGLTPVHGSQMAMSNAARVEFMKRTGIVSAAEVARLGGVSGMVQNMTDNDARYQATRAWSFLPAMLKQDGTLDRDKVMGITSGRTGYRETMERSVSYAKTPGAFSTLEAIMPERLSQLNEMLGPDGMKALMMQQVIGFAKTSGLNMDLEGLTQAARMQLGMSAEDARRFVLEVGGSAETMARQREQTSREMLTNQQEEYIRDASFFGKLKRKWRQVTYDGVGSLYGRWAASSAEERDRQEAIKMGVGPTGLRDRGSSHYTARDFGASSSVRALKKDRGFQTLELANQLANGNKEALAAAEEGRQELLKAGVDVNLVSRVMRDTLSSAGQFSEEVFRAAMYQGFVSSGLSHEEAAQKAKELSQSKNILAYGFSQGVENESAAVSVRGAHAKKVRKASKEDLKEAYRVREVYESRIKDLTVGAGIRGAFTRDTESASTIRDLGNMEGGSRAGLMYSASSILGRMASVKKGSREYEQLKKQLTEVMGQANRGSKSVDRIIALNEEGDTTQIDAMLSAFLSGDAAKDDRVGELLQAGRRTGRNKRADQQGAIARNAISLDKLHAEALSAQKVVAENQPEDQVSNLSPEDAQKYAMEREMIRVLRQLASIMEGVSRNNPSVLGIPNTGTGGRSGSFFTIP